MKEILRPKVYIRDFEISRLSLEDKQGLVNVFAWLIQEDKKQNPALY